MKKLFKVIFLFSLLFLSSNAFAATLSVGTDISRIKNGEVFNATLYLDTVGQSINTLEGDLFYDNNFIKAEAVNIGNSFVNLWVEKPNIKTAGSIHFSGITPGGVVTERSEVLSVVFRAEKEGDVELALKNIYLFINDGAGTQANTKISNTNIQITNDAVGEVAKASIKDTIVPEKFTIIRTKDSSVYDNKYFIAYNSTDKESGVDHYKVCEFWNCVITDSPFLLNNQTPFYYIAVNAYDGSGNQRGSLLVSPFLILLVVLVIIIFALSYFFRRYLPFYKV